MRVEVSVISSRIYESFRPRLELQRKDVKLRTANRSPLKVVGLSHLLVVKGNQSIPQDFFAVKNLNRNLILGHHWLMQNKVRMYLDFGVLRIT